MNDKKELKILRELLWKIGNASAGYNDEKISEIISEIRYGYCYGQSNSYVGQTDEEIEELRVDSLIRLSEM